MFKTDALSCPICEGKPNSNKHRCQDYYDDMQKRTTTITSKDGTISIVTLPSKFDEAKLGSLSTGVTIGDVACIRIPDDVPALREEIKQLKYELWQQRFNNEKNLSIDGIIADKIKELENQKVGLIEFINLMILHRDTEIFEIEIKEYIERISK